MRIHTCRGRPSAGLSRSSGGGRRANLSLYYRPCDFEPLPARFTARDPTPALFQFTSGYRLRYRVVGLSIETFRVLLDVDGRWVAIYGRASRFTPESYRRGVLRRGAVQAALGWFGKELSGSGGLIFMDVGFYERKKMNFEVAFEGGGYGIVSEFYSLVRGVRTIKNYFTGWKTYDI